MSGDVLVFVQLFVLSLFGLLERQNPSDDKFFFSYELTLGLVFCLWLGDPFLSKKST